MNPMGSVIWISYARRFVVIAEHGPGELGAMLVARCWRRSWDHRAEGVSCRGEAVKPPAMPGLLHFAGKV